MFHFPVRFKSQRNGVRVGAVAMEAVTLGLSGISAALAFVDLTRVSGVFPLILVMWTIVIVGMSAVATFGLLTQEARQYFVAR